MISSAYNWVDYIILFIFFMSAVTGLMRGFVKEVVSLVTLIAAFIIASMFSGKLAALFTSAPSVQNIISQSTTAIGTSTAQPMSYAALGLSFGILFAGTVIAGAIVNSILNIAFQAGILGLGNRILGAVFGLVRGFILTLVIIFVVQLSPFGNEVWWRQSHFVAAFQPAVQWLGNIVSPALSNLKQKFESAVQGVGTDFQGIVNTYTGFSR